MWPAHRGIRAIWKDVLAAHHMSATSAGCSLVNLCTTRLLQTSTWPKPRQQDLRDRYTALSGHNGGATQAMLNTKAAMHLMQ